MLLPHAGATRQAYDLFGVPTFVLLAVPMPLAFAVAMFRYGLFEDSVIVNRTLVYGLLTAILGATYVAAISLLGLAFSPIAGGSSAAVAASISRWPRSSGRSEPGSIAALSSRLCEGMDVDELTGHVLAVAPETMHPATASLWLRDGSGPETSG